jgi:glycosyltransferase involved in cell wall biosynthesis
MQTSNHGPLVTTVVDFPAQLDPVPEAMRSRQTTDEEARRSVVFIINSLGRGGAQKQVAQAALRLSERGWSVSVISPLPLVLHARWLEDRGVPVYSLDIRRKFLNPVAVFRMWTLVRRLRPDVMVTFLFHASVLGAVVGRAAGVRRIIASVRSQQMGGPGRERIFRWSSRLWDAAVVNSHGVARELVDRGIIPPDRCHVIPNGIEVPAASAPSSIDLRTELGIPRRTFVWLAVGSLHPPKDYPSLLRAVHGLGQSGVLLLVAGDGPLRPRLEQMRDELGLTERVRFLGDRDDVEPLLRACDAFVSASAWEGMPNAVMEALAAGRPVVATSVGGVPELVEHGVTGWLVARSDPTALSATMGRVMGLTEEARTLTGKRARASILGQYAWDQVIPMWERILMGDPAPSTHPAAEAVGEVVQ